MTDQTAELLARDEKNAHLLSLLRQLNDAHTALKAEHLALEERARRAEQQPPPPGAEQLAKENAELRQKLVRADQEKRLYSLQKQTAEQKLQNLQNELDARGREIQLQKHLASVLKNTADRLALAQGIESLGEIVQENETLQREKGQLLAAHGKLAFEMRQLRTQMQTPPPASDEVQSLREALAAAKQECDLQTGTLTEKLRMQQENAEAEQKLLKEELSQAELRCRTQELVNADLQEQLRPVAALAAEKERLLAENADLQRTLRDMGTQLKRLKMQNIALREKLPPDADGEEAT